MTTLKRFIFVSLLCFLSVLSSFSQVYVSPYENFVTAMDYDNISDYSRAFELYQAAAVKDETRAMNNMAVLYAMGLGVEKNVDKAVSAFKDASFKGDAFAMENYGMCLMLGFGVPINEKEASMWFNRAEDAGYWDMANTYTYRIFDAELSDKSINSVQFVVYTVEDLLPD